MGEVFIDLANFILKNPYIKEKRNYEIYNLWFAKKKCPIKSIGDVKLVLEYIGDLKDIPTNILSDCVNSLENAF